MNKFFFLFLFCLFLSLTVSAKDELKIEGKCKGDDQGKEINITYYSAFDGCRNKSEAALSISNQSSNLKGTRVLGNGLDQYSFMKKYWLVFNDSTGNTSGTLKYRDASGVIRNVLLQCEIYDYEYSECLE